MSTIAASVFGIGWMTTATLAAPALRLNLRRRAAQGREITARLNERFGLDPTLRPAGKLIWMHAASVGETISILPVLEVLSARVAVLLTTGTVTSQQLLQNRLPALKSVHQVMHRFAPLDVPVWVERFLSHWRPDAACFVESELWPNQLAACRRRGIPLMLANARMSERSFAHWRRIPSVSRHLLSAFTSIRARSPQDAARLQALGATRVEAPGDLKFAALPLPVDQAELAHWRALLGGRPVWLAASTHPGEEDIAAAVHTIVSQRFPDLLTIVAPRHPERGPAVAAALRAPRRSVQPEPASTHGLWIADTLGEMGLWYRLAPVTFVGRSLIAPGGGQNPLEPARLGCAIAVGPHTSNFVDHVALLRDADALTQVRDAASLAEFVIAMLSAPDQLSQASQRAAAAAQGHSDLAGRTAAALLAMLGMD